MEIGFLTFLVPMKMGRQWFSDIFLAVELAYILFQGMASPAEKGINMSWYNDILIPFSAGLAIP